MKNWQKALDYFVTGMGFGAIIYLVILGVTYENIGDLRVPLKSVFIVFICSGLIGELSFLFKTALSYLGALILHLIGTFALFSIMMLLIDWQTLLIFVITYAVIWLIIRLIQEKDIRRINRQIKKRNG